MIVPYDWQSPEVQAHWSEVRAKIAAGMPVGAPVDPQADLKSARKQLARAEREVTEWREVVRNLEGKQT